MVNLIYNKIEDWGHYSQVIISVKKKAGKILLWVSLRLTRYIELFSSHSPVQNCTNNITILFFTL